MAVTMEVRCNIAKHHAVINVLQDRCETLRSVLLEGIEAKTSGCGDYYSGHAPSGSMSLEP
jgi:hypothetical protein